ncbi:MAG: hypothetical protein KGL39_10395 [Patescibacteria group bacterium]|nr:hypothetical protein [Patescibacteria group bacterium]
MDEKIKTLAVLALVVIIIVAVCVKDLAVVVMITLGFASALVLAAREAAHKQSDSGLQSTSRLAQTGFDPELTGEAGGLPQAGQQYCPMSTARERSGAAVEADALAAVNGRSTFTGRRERFESYPVPGPHPPMAVSDLPFDDRPLKGYKGAIDIDDYEGGQPSYTGSAQSFPESVDIGSDDSFAYGHHDRRAYAKNPREGNPFDLSRTAAPEAAEPCVDDEADNDSYDADERNAYQVRSRNDSTRVDAGTMRRRKEMDKYFRSEVAAQEEIPWWGRHEI